MIERPGRGAPRRTRAWRAVVGALGLSLVLAVAGCAQGSGNDGDVVDQGYQSGDGSVRTWAPDERGEPVTLSGDDFAGNAVGTEQWRGDVVVLNTWYAACPPCRAEASDLVATAQERADTVHFLGINTTDAAGTALAFERTFEVTYPSIADTSGQAIATLQGVVPIQAVPTTVVLDPEGRVAARVLGEVAKSTLDVLLDDVLAEAEPAAS